MLVPITTLTHFICTGGLLVVAILLLLSRAQHRYKLLLLLATLVTAAWSAVVAIENFGAASVNVGDVTAVVLEQLRSLGWMVVMGYVLSVAYKKVVGPVLASAFFAVSAGGMVCFVWATIVGRSEGPSLIGTSAYVAAIAVATCGLVLVENLFRNAGREARWAVKFLCLALAGMFGYDLVLYAEAALFGRVNAELFAARGIVDALMAPLIVVCAARSKSWPIDLHVSRRLVFHSATVMAVGIYLIGMATVGYLIRLIDSPWGAIARIGFLAFAILALALLLSSTSVHSRIKNFVTRNFFSNKYDYRQEWPSFTGAISDNHAEMSIPIRIIRALGNMLDCTAGGLWVYVEDDQVYRLADSWNVVDFPANILPTETFLLHLARTQGVIDIRKAGETSPSARSVELPSWLGQDRRFEVIVPLTHLSGLIGFVVIGRPRAPRTLDWEDYDLLRTAGRQAASYIAEQQSASQLAKARRFEDFNRQFAFVVHDIKNLAGQMSLILKNAERHGSNPEFQKDVLATVADSLMRMQSLLQEITKQRKASAPVGRLDLVTILRALSEQWKRQLPTCRVELPVEGVDVVADRESIEAVMNHLVHNASEAAGPQGMVEVRVYLDNRPPAGQVGQERRADFSWVTIEISDNGPGMDRKFIEEKLFEPLDTTKSTGFGIGAYQARYLVQRLGGGIDVESEVSRGTRVFVRLPVPPSIGAGKAAMAPSLEKLGASSIR